MKKRDQENLSRRKVIRRAVALVGSMPLLSGCGGGSASAEIASVPSNSLSSTEQPPAGLPPQLPEAPVPAWAANVPSDTWFSLRGTAFRPWADANIPAGAYKGTNPFSAIVNAFCDPAHDPLAGAQYFFGGGHGDGSCNAVCKFDHASLTWSLAGQPTPPSKYPPSYANGGSATQPGPLIYPSGLNGQGFFLPASDLTNPVDHPYATALARGSSHMYAAAAMRGSKIHYFYGVYAEFDTATGTWGGRGVNLGEQLITFRPQFNNVALQQGTVAIYDDVTDRFYVTLNPGDAGGGWRSAIMVFNGDTRKIEAIYETNETSPGHNFGLILNSINICRVGRDLYCFTKTGSFNQPQVMNQGFIFNMDTRGFKRFELTGDIAGTTYINSSTQETIPSWYDGLAIRRWNFDANNKAKIYSVSLLPSGGTGTRESPLLLTQTSRVISGLPPKRPLFIYSRLVFNSGAKCALVLPEADADWVALKLG